MQYYTCELNSKFHQVIYGQSSSQPFRLKIDEYDLGSVGSYFNETSDKYSQIQNQSNITTVNLVKNLKSDESQTFNFSVLINDTSSQDNQLQKITFMNSTNENFNITTENSMGKYVYIPYPYFTSQTSVTHDKEQANGRSIWVVSLSSLSKGKFGGSICNCGYQLYINNRQDNNSISPFVVRDIRGTVSFANWTYQGQLVLDLNTQNQYIQFNNLNYIHQIVLPKITKKLTLDFTNSSANDIKIVIPSNKDCIMNQSLSSVDADDICQLQFKGVINSYTRLDYVQPIYYSSRFTIHILTGWQFQLDEQTIGGIQIFKIQNSVLDNIVIEMQNLQNYQCQFDSQLQNSVDIVCY